MRTFKFRIWSKYNNKMVDDVGICGRAFLKEFEHIVPALQPCNALNQGLEYMRLYSDLELMQWTGLKDKNGVEIYEGDIVHSYFGTVEVEWDERGYGWGPFSWVDNDGVNDWKPEECEVIGNIYEHKTLITKGENK